MFGWSFSRFFKKRNIHERLVDGTNIYYQDGLFGSDKDNVSLCLEHPILTPAIVFITKLMCQAEILIKDKKTNKLNYNDDFIKLIKNPNPLQTIDDFLTEVEFQKIANGVAPIYKKQGVGLSIDSLYVLDVKFLKTIDDEVIDTNQIMFRSDLKKYLDTSLIYDDGFKKFGLKVKDLIFIKDMPNSKTTNLMDMSSRIDGIRQTLINSLDSLVAKNIILKSNGKEMITSGGGANGAFPLSPTEKELIEQKMNTNYGLSFSRARTIVSRANLSWKSMHIALRDLGLDESLKIDSDIIFTALHIPKDIYSINNKKAAYKNYSESMIGFIQNNIKQEVDYILKSIYQNLYNDFSKIVYSDFSHLPIMKKSVKETYDGVKSKADALKSLLDAGLPEKIALKEAGFDENITLNTN